MVPILFTIGYEGHATPRSLVAVLCAAGVELLIDVRELPLSRRPGFSKTALAEALGRAGIEYQHERHLGNPKPLRDLYRSGRQGEGKRRYRAFLRNGSAHAVDRLADVIADQSACILCFEADHGSCHRAVIIEELERRLPQLEVEHL